MIKLSNRDRKQMAEMLAGEIARYERLGMSGVDKGTSCHELDQWFRMSAYRLALAALTAEQAAQTESDDYCNLKELYHAQEKRLFKLAQRIKGPTFDKYAHTTAQAIDVLESALTAEPVIDPITVKALWPKPVRCDYQSEREYLGAISMLKECETVIKAAGGEVEDDDTDAKRRAFIDSLADDTAPQQYESLSTESALKMGMERYGAAMKKLADKGDK